MLYQVTICLLLCQAFGATQQYQSGNTQQLGSPQEEISPVFNEIAPEENGLLEPISYKPVTLEQKYNITSKQQQCLKIGNQLKSISRASLWAPLSNSKHHGTLKVVCGSQQEPKLWFGQSKYQEIDHNEKVQSLINFEDANTAIIGLRSTMGTLSFELPGCNVCVKKNEADSNYVNVFIAADNAVEEKSNGNQLDFQLKESHNQATKTRVKRATTSIKLSTSSARKTVGESLTVTCSAMTSNITWKNPSGKEVKSSVNSDPRVRENFSKSQNYSELIFRSVSAAVEGRYTCTVNEAGKIDNEIFTLTAVLPVVKPKATLIPPENSVKLEEGSEYTVECSGNSNNVSWRHAQNYVIPPYPGGASYFYSSPANMNKTTLYFKNVTTFLAGEFICSVNTSGLQDTQKLVISITKPRLTFSPDDKDTISVKENKEYEITCGGPLRSAVWHYGNGSEISKNKKDDIYQQEMEILSSSSVRRKLKFEGLQIANSGKYICSGILTLNSVRIERSFTLTVQEDNSLSRPKLTVNEDKISSNIYSRVNEDLHVDCTGETEAIEWKGPPYNWKIPETDNSTTERISAYREKKKKVALKIKSVVITDEGKYTCEVSRKTITKSKDFQLYVIDPVRITGFPQSPTSKEGGYVTLGCLTSGHPKALVNWYYNEVHDGIPTSKLIDGQTNPRYKYDGDNLVISNITYREAGKYMCEAKQDIEKGTTDMRTIEVFVQHKPYPSRNRTIYEKKLNSLVQIPCKMTANPPPYYTWSQRVDGLYRILTNPTLDDKLTINLSSESQFGEYKCAANNQIGFNEQYILLIPMEPPRPPRVEIDQVFKNSVHFKAIAERNSSFIYYNVEYKEKGTRDWAGMNITLGESWDSKYELNDLFNTTTYILRVRSINDLGISPPSNEVEFTTISPSSGTRLTVSFIALFAILLKWFL